MRHPGAIAPARLRTLPSADRLCRSGKHNPFFLEEGRRTDQHSAIGFRLGLGRQPGDDIARNFRLGRLDHHFPHAGVRSEHRQRRFGDRESGLDIEGQDAILVMLDMHELTDSVKAALRSAIDEAPAAFANRNRRRHGGGGGAEPDDDASPLLQHDRQNQLRDISLVDQIAEHAFFELVDGERVERVHQPRSAMERVVDQDIDAPPFRDRPGNHRIDRRAVQNVHRHRDHVSAAGNYVGRGLFEAAGHRDVVEVDRHGARLALQMQDEPRARELLRDALTHLGIIPSANKNPSGPPFEPLRDIANELIEAQMPDEMKDLVAMMADPSRSGQAVTPDSRSEKLASLGEAALAVDWKPTAQICAEAALKQLQTDWRNPAQSSYSYSLLVTPKAVHLTCDLLLRLGLSQEFDTLHNLLTQWSTAGTSLDTKALLEDADHLKRILDDNPTRLTPGLWLDQTGDGAAGPTYKAVWDLAANEGKSVRQDLDATSPYALYSSQSSGSLSVEGRDLPQLDGKFSLQILAGDSWDNFRLIKIVSAAQSRGTTEVELKPTDRFIRAIGLTTEAEPRIFFGPAIPISLGANLLGPSLHTRLSPLVNQEHQNQMTSDETVKIATLSGGPDASSSHEKATCPAYSARLELAGPQQNLAPRTTYCQSGWLRGSGQWGVQYLDDRGKKISESNSCSSDGSNDDWHFVRQTFTTLTAGVPSASEVPPNAVTIEPVLSLSQNNSVEFQNLYFGVLEQQPPPPPNHDRSDLMDGLQGATSIVEAPQGNLLAAVFVNGDVRCFDLSTHKEMGISSKLPASPVDVAFVDQGTQIVAADADGNILVRPVQGSVPGKVVYQAHWRIDFLAASNASIVAIGNRDVGNVTVVDLATGREVSRVHLESLPLTTMIISPDGKNLFCRYPDLNGRIWSTVNGQPLSITEQPMNTPPTVPMPDMNFRNMPPFFHGPRREEGAFSINEISLAHFFKIPRVLKTNEWHRSSWLQVQSGFFVLGLDSSLVYGMRPNAEVFLQVDTGSITASCLSTQSNNVYTVNAAGTLTSWKFTDDVKIPDFPAPPEIKIVPPAMANQPVANALIVTAPDHLRGFPHTTLSQTLDITVVDNLGDPVSEADVDLQAQNLNGVTFISDDKTFRSGVDRPDFKTAQDGTLKIGIKLGAKPGSGTIRILVSHQGLKQEQNVSLEAIDQNAPLHQPHDILISSSVGALTVTWGDEPDNRTGFIIERKVDSGPWRRIALVPADSTSYVDSNGIHDHNYYYSIDSTNDSGFGYPPKLPPPPDRLGNFLP